MTRFFLNIYDYLSQRKALAAVLLAAVVALCLLLGLRLRYKENITDFLPQNEENQRYTAVYEGLGDQGQITLIFRPQTDEANVGDAVEAFEEAWHEMADHYDGNDRFNPQEVTLRCTADESAAYEAMEFIADHIALFLTPADYARADSLLAQESYVDSSLHNVKQLLANPIGGIAVGMIAGDPLNLFSPALQRLASLSASDSYTVEDDHVVDREGNAYAFLSSPYTSADTRNNALLARWIEEVVQTTMQRVPEVRVSAVGAPLIAVANATQIKRDSLWAMVLAVVLIVGILVWAMGYKRNILWLGFSVAVGWLFALAVIALFRPSISIIVIGIGTVLVGIAVNYPLHFLDHIREVSDRRSALKDMVEPLVTGNITTVSAFACLVFVRAEAMRDLGLFASLMLVGTILFVMIFLPLFAKAGRRGKTAAAEETSNKPITDNKPRRFAHLTPYALLLVALLTLFLGYHSGKTEFDSDLHNINYMTAQQREDLDLLNRAIDNNDQALVYLVAEGENLDQALARNECALRDTLLLTSAGSLGGPAGLLPSTARQAQSIVRWQQFMREHADLPDQVRQAARRHGFTETAFRPFLSHLAADYHPVPPADMEALSELCGNYLLRSDSLVQVVNLVHLPAAQVDTAVAQFRQHNAASDDLFAFSTTDVGNNLVAALNNDFNYILYVCGFVVFFFLWLSFGRLELALLSFLPLTVGWLWILGLMSLTAVKFNIVNIILATFIFGQGDDYTIFITEGLMYEHAYGKRRLRSYQRSVIISAVLMFVGIGVLIFAKHPAMRSLAEVAIIGMATVILMACFLPPVIFRWLTTRKGRLREVPLTLKRLTRTFLSLLVFFVAAFVVVTPFTFFYRLIGRDSERKRLWFHGLICCFCRLAMKHLPGVSHTLVNPHGETFERPAVVVANHSSHLDLVCMLMLSPRMVFLTNDWVWRNPVYGAIIRYAEFYPVSNGYEANLPQLKALVRRGYSIMIFPEGTRSTGGSVGRFHKGAFQLAQQLGIDLLPVTIHGANHVMPKQDIVLREGAITTFIEQRIAYENFADRNMLEFSIEMRHRCQQRLDEVSRQLENEEYCLPYVRYQYLYKGREIERRAAQRLKHWREYAESDDPGQGEIPLLLALSHPDREYHYTFTDADDYLVATHCAARPANLHYTLKGGEA